MTGSIFKLHRCPDCNKIRREKNPAKSAPQCPKCGSAAAYYSDDWYIAYRVPGARDKMEAVSPSKLRAQAKLDSIVKTIEEGVFEPFKKGLTWPAAKDLLTAYFEAAPMRDGTQRYYLGKIASMDKYLGDFVTTLDKLSKNTLTEIQKFRRKTVSPNTVNKEIAALQHFVVLLSNGSIVRKVDGEELPWLSTNPLTGTTKIALEENPPPEVKWEPDEIEALLGGTDDTFLHAYILMACLAGLRKRTIREFRREWINWKQNRLEIPPAGRKRGKGRFHYVPIADALGIALRKVWVGYRPYNYEDSKYYKEHKDSYYTTEPNAHPYERGFLFCHPSNPEIMWSGFESLWSRLKRTVGIKKRFHDLKHTAGTFYQWATQDIKATMDFLDESTMVMASRYIRDSNEIRNRNMEKFQSLFQEKMVADTPKLPIPE